MAKEESVFEGMAVAILAFLGVMLLVVGLSFLSAYFVMLMVNYLFTATVLTAVFGVPAIGFWQAFVLSLLTGTLFKSTYSSSKK